MAAAFLAPKWIRAPELQENRLAAHRPAWPRRLQDIDAFRTSADAYVADHFPARRHLIGVLNRLRMLAGISGSTRVIIGRGGWLFYDNDSHLGAARNDPPLPEPQVRDLLLSVAARTEMLRSRGAAYLVVVPPVKEAIYPQYAPAWLGRPSPERLAFSLPKVAQDSQAGEILYLEPMVAEATLRGEKTYSPHDTHWTGYGAYAGYVGLMRKLQSMRLTDGPRPRSEFRFVRPGWRGKPRDLAKMLGVSSFVDIDFPHLSDPSGEARRRITYLSARQDWTGPQVVDTGEVGKPVLLMTRDSFSNELLPLMLSHFSRIILAHDQDGVWRQDLIDRFKPDIVILEMLESSLQFSGQGGPAPSVQAMARLDRVLLADSRPSAPTAPSPTPALEPAGARILAALDAATPTPNCNMERATITRGVGAEATVDVGGWIAELGPKITAAEGLIRIKGQGVDLVAPIRTDGSRPDVAAYFKIPTGAASGFVGRYHLDQLPPGAYVDTVYRRSPGGWIFCAGREALATP